MTRKTIARLNRSGGMGIRGELVEIPLGLRSGRNLIENSGDFKSKQGWTGGATLGVKDGHNVLMGVANSGTQLQIQGDNVVKLKEDTYYVYSMEVMFDKDTTIGTSTPIHYHWHNNGVSQGAGEAIELLSDNKALANKWYRGSFRVKTKSSLTTGAYFRPFLYGLPVGTAYWIKNIKLEIGTEATPWILRPEELQVELPDWVESTKNPMSIQKEGLITHEFVEIPEELRGTGGRNLLNDSKAPVKSHSGGLAEVVVTDTPFGKESIYKYTTTTTIGSSLIRIMEAVKESGTYTFSLYARTANPRTSAIIDIDIMDITSKRWTVTDTWQQVDVTVVVDTTRSSYRFVDLGIRTMNTPVLVGFWKLEFGTKATPWSPSPEDLGHDLPRGVKHFGDPIELIGGRNLMKKSKRQVFTPRNAGVASDEYNYIVMPFETAKIGEIYSFSAGVEVTHGQIDKVTVLIRIDGGPSSDLTLPVVDGKISSTFTAKDGENSLFIYAGLAGGTGGKAMILSDIKLEKGDRFTPWTPAPEDLGLVYGRDVQEFKGIGLSMNDEGISLSGELSEVPDSMRFFGSAERTGYLSFPQEVSNSIHGKQEATIEFWVKKLGGTGNYGIVQLSGFQNNNGNIYPYTTDTNIYLDIFKKTRLGPIEMNSSVRELHHLAVTTKPGVNGWRAYQNGELIYTTTGESTVSTDYLDFTIGLNSTNRYANGQFSDIKLWSVARSQQEIKESMQGVLGNKNGLVGHWKCDEGHGKIVYDHSGNNRHGEIIGEVEWLYMMDEEG